LFDRRAGWADKTTNAAEPEAQPEIIADKPLSGIDSHSAPGMPHQPRGQAWAGPEIAGRDRQPCASSGKNSPPLAPAFFVLKNEGFASNAPSGVYIGR
jgi:hypothetical protein